MSEKSLGQMLSEVGLKIYFQELKMGQDLIKYKNISQKDADSLKILDILWDHSWNLWWKDIVK